MEHALGQFDAAAHAAGERFDPVLRPVREADGGQHFAVRDASSAHASP